MSALHQSVRAVTPGLTYDPTLLEFLAKQDPIGSRVCYGVAKDIIENWFEVVDNETEDPIEALNEQAQEWTEDANLRQMLVQLLFSERWGGYAILVDWTQVGDYKPPFVLDVFDRTQYSIKEWNEDTGEPTVYEVTKKLGTKSRQILVPAKSVYHLSTRGDRYEGSSVLLPIYYDLVTAYNLAYSIGQTFFRYGSGFPVVTYPQPIDDDVRDATETILQSFHAVTGWIEEGGATLRFAGVEGFALDPEKYMNPIIDRCSAGTGIPSQIIKGAEAGALASSQTNQTDYWKVIKGEQTLIKWFIEDILTRSAGLPDDNTWKIQWAHPQASALEELEIQERELKLQRLEETPVLDPNNLPTQPNTQPNNQPTTEEPENEEPQNKL